MQPETFMPDALPHERVQVLQDTAIKVEEGNYYAKLSQYDLDLKREKLTDNLVAISNEDAEFEKVKSVYKGKVKPLQADNAILLTEVRTGQELKKGVVYHLPDYENSMVVMYDQTGKKLDERRMRPDEKQGQSRLFIPSGGLKNDSTDRAVNG